jgi:hypothetical protein
LTAVRTVELPIPPGKARITGIAKNTRVEAASDDGPPSLLVTITSIGRSERETHARALAAGADDGRADDASETFTVRPASGGGNAADPEAVVPRSGRRR